MTLSQISVFSLPKTSSNKYIAQLNPEWLSRHKKLVSLARQTTNIQVYFLGDSITEHWDDQGKSPWEKYYSPLGSANFGMSGDQIENVMYRLIHGELGNIKPKVLVLMIGTNNFGHVEGTTPLEIAAGTKEIIAFIRRKSPPTKILLLGIFPRGAEATNPYRSKIKTANFFLSKIDNGKTIKYLDIGPQLLTKDGTISNDVMADGLHLTEKGYEIWARFMNPLLFKMLNLPCPINE